MQFAYEAQINVDGQWKLAAPFDNRDAAVEEARRLAKERRLGVRVVEGRYDDERRPLETRTIFALAEPTGITGPVTWLTRRPLREVERHNEEMRALRLERLRQLRALVAYQLAWSRWLGKLVLGLGALAAVVGVWYLLLRQFGLLF